MKGMVILAIVIALALLPTACLIGRRKGYQFFAASCVVGVLTLAALIAKAYYGFGFTENLTTSLNGYLYVHREGAPFERGDIIAYRWHGGATYPRGTIFIKRVVGMPGDQVRVEGDKVWVNDQFIGVAKPKSRAGVPLTPTAGGVIPAGEYFVATHNPDSLDSRYALSGNIKQFEVIGKAYEIF